MLPWAEGGNILGVMLGTERDGGKGRANRGAVAVQWYVIAAGLIVVIGNAAARLHGLEGPETVGYIQRLFLVAGFTTAAQALVGHRLPILVGPSAILLAGIALLPGVPFAAVYSGIAFFGIVLFALAALGFHERLRRRFTASVAAVVLLLVGASLIPTTIRLVTGCAGSPLFAWALAATVALVSLAGQRWLPPSWRPASLPLVMVAGTGITILTQAGTTPPVASSLVGIEGAFLVEPAFHLEAWLTLGCCYLGLIGNDLGALAALVPVMNPGDRYDPRRGRYAGLWTGIGNLLAGAVGTIGPVNYALSAGVVQATRCEARGPLVGAGIALAATGLLAPVVGWAAQLPTAVIGGALAVVVVGQFQAAHTVVRAFRRGSRVGRSVALPALLGIGVMFLPDAWLEALRGPLRPLVGHGFLVGLALALATASAPNSAAPAPSPEAPTDP